MLQTVYRVENSEGNGPYSALGANGINLMLQKYHGDDYHANTPTPKEDAGIERPMKEDVEFCGFVSMEQLLQWFPEPALELLEDEGLKIVELQAEITEIGQHQVLFVRESVLA